MSELRTIELHEALLRRLIGVFDAIYFGLGSTAPHMSDDAACVLAHVLSRQAGTWRHELGALAPRRHGIPGDAIGDDVASVGELFVDALRFDPSGRLSLYGFSSLVAPRVLVSLRDAAVGAGIGGAALRVCCEDIAAGVVGGVRRVGEVAAAHGPVEDPDWHDAARGLVIGLDSKGFSESFTPDLLG